MGHSEGQWQARVLTDTAAQVRVAHASHVRQAQGFAGVVHGCTQILPAKKEAVTGCLSPMPRGPGGAQASPGQVERVVLLTTLTSDPHMAILEAGAFAHTQPFQHTGTPGRDVCLEQTMLVPLQLP